MHRATTDYLNSFAFTSLQPSSPLILMDPNSEVRVGRVKLTKPAPEYAGYIGIVHTLNHRKPNWEVKCSIGSFKESVSR